MSTKTGTFFSLVFAMAAFLSPRFPTVWAIQP